MTMRLMSLSTHSSQPQSFMSFPAPSSMVGEGQAPRPSSMSTSKRKAESQENERLNKRLSLLNLERNGPKLYVPVETPAISSRPTITPQSVANHQQPQQETMQLDDTKHKVYIYDIDDELTSDDESDDGRLVFLPDIEKHLRENRIPRHILANEDGEIAGMQMVLYSDPKSLSVPESKDGVRKAIIEARDRLRAKQKQDRQPSSPSTTTGVHAHQAIDGIQASSSPTFASDEDAMDMD